MKENIRKVVLFICAIFTLIGCSLNDPSEVLEVSDEKYDTTFKLQGDVIKLPMKFSDFEKLGWKMSTDETETIKAEDSDEFTLAKDDVKIYAEISNPTKSAIKAKEGIIVEMGLSIDGYDDGAPADVQLSQGVDFTSTVGDLEKVYGVPTDLVDSNKSQFAILSYYTGSYREIGYRFLFRTDKKNNLALRKIEIRNNSITDEMKLGYKSKVVTTPPKSMDLYSQPTSTGTEWDDFNIKLENEIYRLPIPMPRLLEKGFALISEDVEVAGESSEYAIELRIGNETVRVHVKNFEEVGHLVSNCYVTSIKFNTFSSIQSLFDFELPGNISNHSTLNDVESAYGSGKIDDDSSFSTSLSYGDYASGLRFSFNKETGKMNSMEYYTNE